MINRTLTWASLALICVLTSAGCGGGGGAGGTTPPFLIADWPADGNYHDVAGAHTGFPVGGMTFAAGKHGQAFSFDGSSSIFVPDSPALAFTHSMAITAWIKPAAYPSNQALIVFRGDDRVGLDPYYLDISPAGALRFHICDANGNTALAQSASPIPLRVWTYVGASLDDSTGAMAVYVNGSLAGTTTTTVRPFSSLDPTQVPGIGIGNVQSTNYAEHYLGLIDDLKLYDDASPNVKTPS